MNPLKISSATLVNALGRGMEATYDALCSKRSGLRQADEPGIEFNTWIGKVSGLEDHPLDGNWKHFDCRNNRLAKLCLDTDGFKSNVEKVRDHYGSSRVGLILGTSTSGIASTEQAYQQMDGKTGNLPESFDFLKTHNIHSLVTFCQQYLGLNGLGLTISTACSSSAKVFAAAARYIESGLCDAAVVGGVDSLCLTTLYGFHSLELVSTQPCRPWDANRDGISIGESAGFVVLEKADDSSDVVLKSYGESSDAYHMSTPHPEGIGAALAMRAAIERADIDVTDIGYVNLHGTATPSNDTAEDRAVVDIFGDKIPCSSTKGWTGHALGAAGITEALIAKLVLDRDFLPTNLNMTDKDSALSANILTDNQHKRVNNVISNSFGFGGSNCCLLLGR